jgi:hypothetical protein
MTGIRTLVVVATIAGTIGMSLVAIARDRMLWPFSNYPMYSGHYGPTTAITRAVGIADDGSDVPLPARVEPTGLHLHIVIDHALRRPADPVRLTQIAAALGREYEALRAAGEVEGPQLRGIRILRDTIDLRIEPHVHRSVLLAQWMQ